MGKNKYYAVQNGRNTGVYSSWEECLAQVSGYSGAVFKSFSDASSAASFASRNSRTGVAGNASRVSVGTEPGSLGSGTDHVSGSSNPHSDSYSSPAPHHSQSHSHQVTAPLPSLSASNPNSEPKQTFYAVANGRTTGVFNDWDSCKSNVTGFQGAVYKKFTSRAEAESYVTQNAPTSITDVPLELADIRKARNSTIDQRPSSAPSSRVSKPNPSKTQQGPKKSFYGVNFRDGSSQIFTDWNACKGAVQGKKGVTYKKFDNLSAAKTFTTSLDKPILTESERQMSIDLFLQNSSKENLSVQKSQGPHSIYTDGSYLGGSGKGGIGVYYGPDDARNVAEPVIGAEDSYSPEVKALGRALQTISKEIDSYYEYQGSSIFPKYQIFSDSQAVTNILNNYAKTWSNADFESRKDGAALWEMYQDYTKIKDFYHKNSGVFNDHEFTVTWIKGHAGTPGNVAADYLARKGADKA